MSDAFVKDEFQLGSVTGVDSISNFPLKKSSGMLEPMDTPFLFLLVSHDRDVDSCTAQITTYLHVGYRGILDPWIMQVHHDGITHYLANGLGNFE